MMTTAIGSAMVAATALARGAAARCGPSAARRPASASSPRPTTARPRSRRSSSRSSCSRSRSQLERTAAGRRLAARAGRAARPAGGRGAGHVRRARTGVDGRHGRARCWSPTALAARRLPDRGEVRRVIVLGAGAVAVLLVASLPQIDRLVTFNAAEQRRRRQRPEAVPRQPRRLPAAAPGARASGPAATTGCRPPSWARRPSTCCAALVARGPAGGDQRPAPTSVRARERARSPRWRSTSSTGRRRART